jgi:hypothetical protein
MQYVTKRQKITKYLKGMFNSLIEADKEIAQKDKLVASASLDLGVKESEVLEVLDTYHNAGIVKINDNEVFIYG